MRLLFHESPRISGGLRHMCGSHGDSHDGEDRLGGRAQEETGAGDIFASCRGPAGTGLAQCGFRFQTGDEFLFVCGTVAQFAPNISEAFGEG